MGNLGELGDARSHVDRKRPERVAADIAHVGSTGVRDGRPIGGGSPQLLCLNPATVHPDPHLTMTTFSMIAVCGGPDVPDELLLVEEGLGPFDVVLFPSHLRSPRYHVTSCL